MKAGDICKRNGIYCCGYHKRNKIRIMEGKPFPACGYSSLNCEGFWCWLKEWHEKTFEEIKEANLRRKMANDRAKDRMRMRSDDWVSPRERWKWDWEKW